jgi:MoxR-like ATPase
MQERTVSVGGIQRELSKIFFVVATQNPIEYEATFPLPEAQRDRFQMQIDIDFPTEDEERAIVDSYADGSRLHEEVLETMKPVMSLAEIHEIRSVVKNDIKVNEDIRKIIVQVVNTTREDVDVRIGASSRGSIAMLDSARGFALLRGRDHVIPDDLRDSIVPTLIHRVVMAGDAEPRLMLEAIARRVTADGEFHCRRTGR